MGIAVTPRDWLDKGFYRHLEYGNVIPIYLGEQ